MYPGLPSRLEKEMKQLYLNKVLHNDPERLNVSLFFFLSLSPISSLQEQMVTTALPPLFSLPPAISTSRSSRFASRTRQGASTWSSSEELSSPTS